MINPLRLESTSYVFEVECQCWCMEAHQGRWSVSAGACMEGDSSLGGASVLVHGGSSGKVECQCWCMEAHQGRWSVSADAWRLIRGGGVSVVVCDI